jgi:hypothetical protein
VAQAGLRHSQQDDVKKTSELASVMCHNCTTIPSPTWHNALLHRCLGRVQGVSHAVLLLTNLNLQGSE